jgi:hypothetical protein
MTSDGGFLLCGSIASGLESYLAIIKTDSIGSIQWRHEYSTDFGEGIFINSINSNRSLICGYNRPLDTSLVIIDSEGDVKSSKILSEINASFIKICADDRVIIGGQVNGNQEDGYLICTDLNFNLSNNIISVNIPTYHLIL